MDSCYNCIYFRNYQSSKKSTKMMKIFNDKNQFFDFIQNFEGELSINKNKVFFNNQIIAKYEKINNLQLFENQ